MLFGIALFGALQKYVRRAKTSRSIPNEEEAIPDEAELPLAESMRENNIQQLEKIR